MWRPHQNTLVCLHTSVFRSGELRISPIRAQERDEAHSAELVKRMARRGWRAKALRHF